MEQTLNSISVVGKLVSIGLEKKNKVDNGVTKESITGDLIVRTEDGSESEIRYFANKLTKDGKENKLYKGLETVMNEYKSLEKFPNEADVIEVTGAEFTINDYKGQDGEVKSYNQIKSNFAKRLTAQEIEIKKQVSKFDIEGILVKMTEETYKDMPTGNLKLVVDVLGYEGTIIPVTVIVPKPIVEGFQSGGYYEGCVVNLWGKIVNTKESKEIIEEASFGASQVKTVTSTTKRFEVTGGKPPKTIYDLKIDETEYNQAKGKRKLKLDEVKNKVAATPTTNASTPVTNPFGGTTTPSAGFNPFAVK